MCLSANPFGLFGPSSGTDASAQAARDEKKRQQQISDALARVNTIFSSPARTKQYQDYQANTMGVLRHALDRKAQITGRNLKFGLARQGQTGGSVDADKQGTFLQDYERGVLNAAKQAREAASNLRAADQQSKQNIAGLVEHGMDATTAMRQGNQALQSNLQSAQDMILPGTIDSIFSDLAPSYQRSLQNQGTQQGLARAGSAFRTSYPNLAQGGWGSAVNNAFADYSSMLAPGG